MSEEHWSEKYLRQTLKGWQRPSFPTKDELERLKADRENDPPKYTVKNPRPKWAQPSDAEDRIRIYVREWRIRFIERRFETARQGMKKSFNRRSR